MRHDWAPDNCATRNYGIAQRTDRSQFAELLKIVLMLSLLAGVFVIRSWQQNRIVSIGYESQTLQSIEETLLREQKSLVLEEATLKDPARIEGLAYGLGFDRVRANQILPARYPEPEAAGAVLPIAATSGTAGGSELAMNTPSVSIPGKKLGAAN